MQSQHDELYRAQLLTNLDGNIRILKHLKKIKFIDENAKLITREQMKLQDPLLFFPNADEMSDEELAEAIESYLFEVLISTEDELEGGNKILANSDEYNDIYAVQADDFIDEATGFNNLRSILYRQKSYSTMLQDYQVAPGEIDRKLQQDRLDYAHSYVRENHFKYWPINKMGNLPLYASMGPILEATNTNFEKKTGMYLLSYFQTLISGDPNIQQVVALGYPGIDFLDYFQEGIHEYNLPDENNDVQRVVITSTKTSSKCVYPGKDAPSSIYQNDYILNIAIYKGADPGFYTERNIKLCNILSPDGMAINMDAKHNLQFNDYLLKMLSPQEGVLVHCRAGLGRTGQIIGQLAALITDNAKRFFNKDMSINREEVKKFVAVIRSYRPGLLLELSQIERMLLNLQRYYQLKNAPPQIEKQKNEVVSNEKAAQKRNSSSLFTESKGGLYKKIKETQETKEIEDTKEIKEAKEIEEGESKVMGIEKRSSNT